MVNASAIITGATNRSPTNHLPLRLSLIVARNDPTYDRKSNRYKMRWLTNSLGLLIGRAKTKKVLKETTKAYQNVVW